MTNQEQRGMATVAKAASITAETLLTLQKSIIDAIDSNMDIIAVSDQRMMTDKQKSFLVHLLKINHPDKGELSVKLDQLNSGLTRYDADCLIKQYT